MSITWTVQPVRRATTREMADRAVRATASVRAAVVVMVSSGRVFAAGGLPADTHILAGY